MGRCTPCSLANESCIVLKGYSKCCRCTSRGERSCDGDFSELEFNQLEQQKAVLRVRAQEKRAEVGRLAAAAAAAYQALAAAQKEEIDIQNELDRHTESQSQMLVRELETLDALDALDSSAVVSLDDGLSLPWVSS